MFQNKKRILCLLLALLFAAEGPFVLNRQAEVSAAEVVLPTVLPGAIWSLLGAAGVAAGLGIADSVPDSDYAAAAEKLKSLITDMNEQGCLPSSLSSLVTVAADAGAATGDLTDAFCNYMKEEGLILENKDLEKKYSEYEKEPDKNKNEDKKKKVIGVGGDVLKKIAENLLDGFVNFGKKLQEENNPADDDVLIKALSTLPTAEQAEKDSERTPYSNYILFKAEPTMDNNANSVVKFKSDAGYYMFWYNDMGNSGKTAEEYYDGVFKPYSRTSIYMIFQFWNKDSNGIFYHYNEASNIWEVISSQHGPGNSYGVPSMQIYDCRQNFLIKFNSATLTINRYVDTSNFVTNNERYNDVIAPNPLPDLNNISSSPAVCIRNYITKNYENITYSNDVYDYSTGNTVNNFYTDNSYLLPADPADVVRDIVAPATTVVNNNNTTINNETVGQVGNIFHQNTTNTTNNMKMTDVINYNELIADGTFNEYTYEGLDKYFPFSIPSDIILFLKVLAAEPRAPEFDFTLPLSVVGLQDYTIHVDLSSFDRLAEILREVELFSGAVGLVFLTRKMMK